MYINSTFLREVSINLRGDMMRIPEARLNVGVNPTLISLSDVSREKYYKELRGNLYCPTPNCNAKLIYSSGENLILELGNIIYIPQIVNMDLIIT